MDTVKTQVEAQFDWLQERLADPNFVGIAISGNGAFISATELRKITNGDDLMRILQQAFPITPLEKELGKSEDNV